MHHVHTGVVMLVPHTGAAAGVAPGSTDSLDEGWLVRSFSCTTEVSGRGRGGGGLWLQVERGGAAGAGPDDARGAIRTRAGIRVGACPCTL
jgi:hypothetical protein